VFEVLDMTVNNLFPWIWIAFGISVIIFRRHYVRWQLLSWNKKLDARHIRILEALEVAAGLIAVVVGTVFLIRG
jgi:hypothetical protein